MQAKSQYKDPLISVYTTVYNNAYAVEKSIESIVRQLSGLSYEIVVIDNYSTDGTFEKLLKLSKKYPIRVYRYRSSRGLGRAIAALMSRGRYLVYVDLDCVYTDTLRKLIELHLHSIYRDSKCLGLLVCPRDILVRENFLDLNRSEDVELFSRLAKKNLIYVNPPLRNIQRPLRHELRPINASVQKLIPTFISERRYSKNILGYIKREFINKLHYIIGSGTNLKKFIREELIVWEQWRKRNKILTLIRIYIYAFLYILVRLIGIKPREYDKDLSNHLFVDLMGPKYYAAPSELGVSCSDITLINDDELKNLLYNISYVLRFKNINEFKGLINILNECKNKIAKNN